MTKQELDMLTYMDRRINSKLEQVDRLRDLATCAPSTTGTERVQTHRKDNSKLIDRLIDLETSVNNDIDELVALKERAAEFFKTLPVRDRLLMELRYFEGLTWERVADRMGYTSRHVMRLHGMILEKI